ncbi:MAG: hypothetical protein ACI4I9_01255 [Porcipelethomonas sp.]
MFSRISCEFEMVEFAEAASKRIKETVSGPKKIRIRYNRNKFSALSDGAAAQTHGEMFVLLPTAVTSYNYITGQITRPLDSSQYKEPVLTQSVILEITFETAQSDTVRQILVSSGGYDISPCKNADLR